MAKPQDTRGPRNIIVAGAAGRRYRVILLLSTRRVFAEGRRVAAEGRRVGADTVFAPADEVGAGGR